MSVKSVVTAMSIAISICCSAIAYGQTTSTLAAQTKNNTSACSAVNVPPGCFLVPDLTTATANTNAQTKALTPTPGNVSPDSIKTDYLYSGATTRIISAYQPWFSPETGSLPCYVYPSGGYTGTGSHPCSGYNENLAATVKLQHTTMLSRGFTDVSPDWYGNSSSQTFLNNTVIAEAADLASRTNYPLKLMIMIDKGLITAGMAASAHNAAAPACPENSSATTACITAVLEAAYDYIDGYWGNQPYYSNDASGNHMSLTFLDECSWPDTTPSCNNTGAVDWPTVWSNVKSYMSRYAKPYKIVKQFGNFTEAHIDGAYIWPQPSPYNNGSPNSQYCWAWPSSSGSSCAPYDYISDYYGKARAAYQSSGAIQMGGMYVGFDGSNNNYNHNLMARQCGQLFGFLGTAISTAGYSSSSQLPWLLVATWNDLGEGSNVENGVDDCWRIATPTMSGSVATWTQTKTDSTYASPATISYFKIWYGTGAGDLTLSQNNILPASHCNSGVTSCTFDLSSATFPPPAGKTWSIYIQQIPKALLFTEINGGGNGNGGPGTYIH